MKLTVQKQKHLYMHLLFIQSNESCTWVVIQCGKKAMGLGHIGLNLNSNSSVYCLNKFIYISDS